VIVWVLTVAAGGANWGELRVAFCVFLALCFFSPVALAFAAPSSVSDNGGVAVVGGAAASNGRERDAQVTVVSPFYADAQVLPFFLTSFAAKLAGEEDGRRLRKNDGGVGNAGDGGGAGVAPAVDAVSKLREQKWWLVMKVVFFSVQRRKPLFFFAGRSSLLQKCPPLKAVVGFPPLPFLFFPACIYRQPGRGSPYPVQVQGMGLHLIFLP